MAGLNQNKKTERTLRDWIDCSMDCGLILVSQLAVFKASHLEVEQGWWHALITLSQNPEQK